MSWWVRIIESLYLSLKKQLIYFSNFRKLWLCPILGTKGQWTQLVEDCVFSNSRCAISKWDLWQHRGVLLRKVAFLGSLIWNVKACTFRKNIKEITVSRWAQAISEESLLFTWFNYLFFVGWYFRVTRFSLPILLLSILQSNCFVLFTFNTRSFITSDIRNYYLNVN